MDTITKVFLVIAGLVITCAVISLAVLSTQKTVEGGNDMIQANERLQSEMSNSDLLSRDGVEHQGSEVVNFIKKYKDTELIIVVVRPSYTVCYNKEVSWNRSTKTFDKSTATDISKSTQDARIDGLRRKDASSGKYYLNPAKLFMCYAVYDDYGDVIGMAFEEE